MIADRRKGDEANAPWKLSGGIGRDLQGESSFPDAARTGEGHELHVHAAQELSERSRFVLAANEGGALHGQVVGARFGRARVRLGETVSHCGEVASQIMRRGVALLGVFGQTAIHDPKERRGRLQHSGTETLGLIAKDRGHSLRMSSFPECRKSGDHLVEN